jgi:hypothetical protein
MNQEVRHQFAVIAALLAVAFTSGCNRSPSFSNVSGGATVSSGDWWFSSGSFFLQPNEPGVLFGMQKSPDGSREFSYVVIFLHDSPNVTRPPQPSVSFDGSVASMSDGVAFNGDGIDFTLVLETDSKSKKIQPTKMTIDGEAVDPEKGTLILVDLTASPVAYKQVKAEFPGEFPEPVQTATVVTMAQRLTKQLRAENDTVDEFLTNQGFTDAAKDEE